MRVHTEKEKVKLRQIDEVKLCNMYMGINPMKGNGNGSVVEAE